MKNILLLLLSFNIYSATNFFNCKDYINPKQWPKVANEGVKEGVNVKTQNCSPVRVLDDGSIDYSPTSKRIKKDGKEVIEQSCFVQDFNGEDPSKLLKVTQQFEVETDEKNNPTKITQIFYPKTQKGVDEYKDHLQSHFNLPLYFTKRNAEAMGLDWDSYVDYRDSYKNLRDSSKPKDIEKRKKVVAKYSKLINSQLGVSLSLSDAQLDELKINKEVYTKYVEEFNKLKANENSDDKTKREELFKKFDEVAQAQAFYMPLNRSIEFEYIDGTCFPKEVKEKYLLGDDPNGKEVDNLILDRQLCDMVTKIVQEYDKYGDVNKCFSLAQSKGFQKKMTEVYKYQIGKTIPNSAPPPWAYPEFGMQFRPHSSLQGDGDINRNPSPTDLGKMYNECLNVFDPILHSFVDFKKEDAAKKAEQK